MVNGATNMATATTTADIIIAQLPGRKKSRCAAAACVPTDLHELKLYRAEGALKMGSGEKFMIFVASFWGGGGQTQEDVGVLSPEPSFEYQILTQIIL